MHKQKPRYPFLTGTRAYGPAREDSDWDIVMLYGHALQVRKMLKLFGTEPVPANNASESGFKFMAGSKEVMIIEVEGEEYDNWEYATKKMIELGSIEDRNVRIETFVQFIHDYMTQNIN